MSLTDVIVASKAGFLTGVRNLIPYPYNHTTKTENGITWTDNGDGTVHAKGTASARSSFYLTEYRGGIKLNAGRYAFNTGIQNENANAFCSLEIVEPSTGYVGLKMKSYEGSSFVITGEEVANNYRITPMLYVSAGATVDVTFKPMLECGRIAHDYMPYHFGGAKDADTVDGWNFYSSLSELGLTEATATAESIVNAMADNSMLLHKLGGTATNAPIQFPYNYSTLRVTKLNTSYVVFECIGTGNSLIQYGYYNGGSSVKWSGWSTKFLPLTGGTLSGDIYIKKSYNTTETRIIQYNGDTFLRNRVDDKNYRDLRIGPTLDLTFATVTNGATVNNTVLHTGNSQKVTITTDASTPPSTMEGLWAY